MPKTAEGIPLAEIFILVGFFLTYIIEELTHNLMEICMGKNASHSHQFVEAEKFLDTDDANVTNERTSTEDRIVSAMRGFLVVLALSLHEMFEGIALGLATTER